MKTPTLAVQVVVSLRDVPVATALTMFFMQAGSAVFLAVGQAVLLNNLLPQMQAINPALTTTDLVQAGAIGLKQLVSEAQGPAVLVAYARSLDAAFHASVAMAGVAVITAFGVEWKSLKRTGIATVEGAETTKDEVNVNIEVHTVEK